MATLRVRRMNSLSLKPQKAENIGYIRTAQKQNKGKMEGRKKWGGKEGKRREGKKEKEVQRRQLK